MHDPRGTHVLFDVVGVLPGVLDDADQVGAAMTAAARSAGATVRAVHVERFEPVGLSVLVVLAESHVSAHTYPERGVAMCDAFTCGAPDPTVIARGLADRLGGRCRYLEIVNRSPDR